MNKVEKMERALDLALSLLDLKEGEAYKNIRQQDIDAIKAARAMPKRQCDVGTAEEQAKRYANHCDTYLCEDGGNPCTCCPCCGEIPFGKCEFAWEQMPYESEVSHG